MMSPDIDEYTLNFPNRRFVLIEKRNKLAELFLFSVAINWDSVIFMNNDIILMRSDSLRKILLIAHSQKIKVTNDNKLFSIFSEYNEEGTDKKFNMAIIVDYDFSDLLKNLKIPQFINWNLRTISMCLDSIPHIQNHMKQYNNNLNNYKEIESSLIMLGIELKNQNKNLINSYYEKYNNDFFETPIL